MQQEGFSTYLARRTGAYLALLVMVPLALLFIWGWPTCCARASASQPPFERFEARRFSLVILLLFSGGAAVALL